MPEVWIFIVGGILLLIVFGVVSSKLKKRKQRVLREKSLPFVEDNVRPRCRPRVVAKQLAEPSENLALRQYASENAA